MHDKFGEIPTIVDDLIESPTVKGVETTTWKERLWRTAGAVCFLGMYFTGGHIKTPDELLLTNSHATEEIEDRIRVMTANVHGWEGEDGNNFDTFAEVILRTNPDVICMQEVKAGGEELLFLHSMGYNVYFVETVEYPGRQPEGNAIATRTPMTAVHNFRLPNSTRIYERIPRGAALAEVETAFGNLQFTSTHLSNVDEREAILQTNLLYDTIKTTPWFVCGDFNQTRAQLTTGAFGAVLANQIYYEEEPSFPSWNPQEPIDHFISACALLIEGSMGSHHIDSDHLALIADFSIKNC